MTISSVLNGGTPILDTRPGINIKRLLFIATPVALCAAGAYIYYNKHQHVESKSLDIPKTPLEKAIALKDKGNKYFKGSKYEQAIACYTEAIITCPDNALLDLSTFYQNRAAAKENLSQIESAIDDCTMALKYSPRYLKALNRRAKLYEKTSKPYLSLLDATATTIFESFSNAENFFFMEKVLTQIAAENFELEKKKIKYELPANSFIRNYFSAFYWDPLVCEQNELIKSSPIFTDAQSIFPEKDLNLPFEELVLTLSSLNVENAMTYFLKSLRYAIELLRDNQFEDSFKTINVVLREDEDFKNLQTDEVSYQKILIFIALAKLLQATFFSLSGKINDSHKLLDDILKIHQEGSNSALDSIINGSEEWSKHPMLIMIKTNALIKKACLIMTAEHDVASSLSAFQQAEQLCPQCPDLYLHRGQIFILTEQYNEAINDFNRAIKLQPNGSVVRCQRIFASYRKAVMESDTDRARNRIEEFKKLITKYPDCIESRSLYAQILSERFAFTEADEEFKEVLRISPDSGVFYGHYAMMHLRWTQNTETAKKIILQGIESDEKCGMLHELLAQLCLESGDFDVSLKHLDRAIYLTANEPELKHLLALQIGAKAQKEVCDIFGITKEEIKIWHKTCQEKILASMQSLRVS